MQLTYNNQSLLAGGCSEERDCGLTRMGREVVGEMNRLGMAIDMSHSGDASTLQAMELSRRPIAITHANPKFWRDCPRNKSDAVLRALGDSGGMLGLSLYPHHLKDGSECGLLSFCEMAARAAEIIGPRQLGIGSDLCRGTSRFCRSLDARWAVAQKCGRRIRRRVSAAAGMVSIRRRF